MSYEVVMVLLNCLGKLLVLDCQTFGLDVPSCGEVLRSVLGRDCAKFRMAGHQTARYSGAWEDLKSWFE